jgi:hypothetical protein
MQWCDIVLQGKGARRFPAKEVAKVRFKIALSLFVFFNHFAWVQAKESSGLSVLISVGKKQCVLDPGKKIPVRIEVRDNKGSGIDGLPLQLACTAGKFFNPTEQGQGVYAATFQMPNNNRPQQVILAAKAPGERPGWTTLDLLSSTSLPVETTEANIKITLEIKNKSYGPVQSDQHGQARIPVVIGPWDKSARVIAVDDMGNRNTHDIQIPIPPATRLLGFANRSHLAADGHEFSDIYLVAMNPNGKPAAEIKLVAKRQVGSVSKTQRLSPGLFHLRFTAPGEKNTEEIKLALALEKEERLNHLEFTFRLISGQPDALTLEAEPTQLFSDGVSESLLTMTVSDRAANPLDGFVPKLRCERGSVSQVTEMDQGTYQALFKAPRGHVGPLTCHASLMGREAKEIKAAVKLALFLPRPAKLLVQPERRKTPMDGKSTIQINILVADMRGDPIADVPIRVLAGAGRISPVKQVDRGSYSTIYTPPRGTQDSRVLLEVIAGRGKSQIKSQTVVELTGVVPPLPRVSIHAATTLTSNFRRMTYGGLNLELTFRLGAHFYLAMESGYRYGRKKNNIGFGRGMTTNIEFAPLHLLVFCKPWPHADFSPFLGLGGGYEFVQWSIQHPNSHWERDHTAISGALASVGVDAKAGQGAISLAVRYLYAYLSKRAEVEQNQAVGGSKVNGNIGGWEAILGYRLFF